MNAHAPHRFRNPRYAFADLLNTYLALNAVPRSRLLDRLNVKLTAKGLKTIGALARVTEWCNGEKLPSRDVVDALCESLHDRAGSLQTAREITDGVLGPVKRAINANRPTKHIKDPKDWRLRLCQEHLERRLNDPVWSELLTILLLTLPDRVRAFLAVRQKSFGRYTFEARKPKDGQQTALNAPEAMYVESSSEKETVQYLAVNARLPYGCVIWHRDEFPGFEYSVGVGGSGVFIVAQDSEALLVKLYPIQAGSCVGYGASLPHAVVATDEGGLHLCHFCFPYRRGPKASPHGGSSHTFNILGRAKIERHGPESAVLRALGRLRSALKASRSFDASPPALADLFKADTNISVQMG